MADLDDFVAEMTKAASAVGLICDPTRVTIHVIVEEPVDPEAENPFPGGPWQVGHQLSLAHVREQPDAAALAAEGIAIVQKMRPVKR